jgi:hypothetical protein
MKHLFSAAGVLLTAALALAQDIELHPKVQRIDVEHPGPFVNLPGDGILCVVGNKALISHDDGRSWQAHDMFGDPPLKARPEQALRRLRDDTIVLIVRDDNDKRWKWSGQTNTTDGPATMQGGLRCRLHESDFINGDQR